MTRHLYKHRVTGIIAPLNDTFAAVFGDRFERVGAEDTATSEPTPAPAPTPAPTPAVDANPANTADAPKEASN